MGYLNTTTNVTTPANASIYSNTSNIPSPTPVSTAAASSSIASGGAIPTANDTGQHGLSSTTSGPGPSDTSATGATTSPTRASGAESNSPNYIFFASLSLTSVLVVLSK